MKAQASQPAGASSKEEKPTAPQFDAPVFGGGVSREQRREKMSSVMREVWLSRVEHASVRHWLNGYTNPSRLKNPETGHHH